MMQWLITLLVIFVLSCIDSVSVDVDNPYKLLDVPVDATEKAIKKAYRTMAVKHHPDKHSPEEAEKFSNRFMRISSAYETLMDPMKRRVYDQTTRPRQQDKKFNQQRQRNNFHHNFRGPPKPPPRSPPRGRTPPPHFNPPRPTIYNYYSPNDKIFMPPTLSADGLNIWIVHLFTSTKPKCPQCFAFVNSFKQLATKLDALGYKVGAMNCAKDILKCRRHEAGLRGGISLKESQNQFVPSVTIIIGKESHKVSGSPYVCMSDADCSGDANKRVANTAGLYSTIFSKIQSLQVDEIAQWSDLQRFLSRDHAKPTMQNFGLLLWSARNEIDKVLTHKFINIAYAFNVTLGTIRNTMTANKAFGRLFHLEHDLEHGLTRELFPLLLVQCHSDDFLFTAYLRVPYTGSLASLGDVDTFLKGVIDQNSCRRVIKDAQQHRRNTEQIACTTLRRLNRAALLEMKVLELQRLGRDIFGRNLNFVHRSGLTRSALLGMAAMEGGSRLTIDKTDIVSALLEYVELESDCLNLEERYQQAIDINGDI